MAEYPLSIVRRDQDGVAANIKELLKQRPFTRFNYNLQQDAQRFVPGDELESAINVAIAVGEPLLITGEPGTGKTQSAYYIAYKLGIEPVIHFQVKSDSVAKDLLYHYDAVAYLREAYVQNRSAEDSANETRELSKSNYVERRALWEAFESEEPRVVLIDEIDKAPRDFPNDLLHEINRLEFTVNETGKKIEAPLQNRPIVVITSNSERHLPEPFLRRCVYHNIQFDDALLDQILKAHEPDFHRLDESFVRLAVERFLTLRKLALRKKPSTSELLVWLRVLAIASGQGQVEFGDGPETTPYLGMLLKDVNDIELVANRR